MNQFKDEISVYLISLSKPPDLFSSPMLSELMPKFLNYFFPDQKFPTSHFTFQNLKKNFLVE